MAHQSRSLEIHQTLHGYQDGHQLIATSLELPAITRRIMLSLSDLSGSSSGFSFDSYLTGYPLAEVGAYAFARTWYAAEMRRPGCVWTHSLLIPFDGLELIDNFAKLTTLFVRPSRDNYGKEQYQIGTIYTEAALKCLLPPQPSSLHEHEVVIRQTLRFLYGKPDAPVLIPVSNFDVYENFVLALLSQQWPRLQRNFTFCTGTFSPRFLSGHPFDLQIIPHHATPKFQRDLPTACVARNNGISDNPNVSSPLWEDEAYRDILHTSYAFRKVLRRVGVDAPPERKAFILIADTLHDVEEVNAGRLRLLALMEAVTERFPSPYEAFSLKYALFGGTTSETSLLVQASEFDILTALASCNGYKAFDSDGLQIQQRVVTMVKHDFAQTAQFIIRLIQSTLNSLGEKLLGLTFKVLSEDELLSISAIRPSLLPVFVSHHPNLATSSIVWKGSLDQQQQIVDALIKRTDVAWETIIPVILQCPAQEIIQELVGVLGYTMYRAILDAINQSPEPDKFISDTVKSEWLRLLAAQPAYIVKWLKTTDNLRVETLVSIVGLLNPHSIEVGQIDGGMWLTLAEQSASLSRKKDRVAVLAFLLAVALDNSDIASPKLAALSFESVHDAAGNDGLPQQCWRWFQGLAPTFEYWKDWDKCEKLRQLFVNTFIKYNWPPLFFLTALTKEETFLRCLDYCESSTQGKRFVARLYKVIESKPDESAYFYNQVFKDKKRRKRFDIY